MGICFSSDHRIVLVTPNGADWSLPGGSPEPGETLEQTPAREVHEEACARVIDSSYIGCQRVEELDRERLPYYNTRFWAPGRARRVPARARDDRSTARRA